jgi:hypothetical protein
MARYFAHTLGIIIMAGFFSCKTKSTDAASGREKPSCGLGWTQNAQPDTVSSDAFELLDATFNGRCLDITVRYGGGCGGADFFLLWNGTMGESAPAQARLRLVLKDQDHCRALLTQTLSFDIGTIAQKQAVDFYLNERPEPLRFDPKAGY